MNFGHDKHVAGKNRPVVKERHGVFGGRHQGCTEGSCNDATEQTRLRGIGRGIGRGVCWGVSDRGSGGVGGAGGHDWQGTVDGMRIAFGTDDSTQLTMSLLAYLREGGHELEVVAYPEPWSDAGRMVGEAVASGRAERGIVCCFSGTGVSIAANKVRGVRAALCTDAETAAGARRWNDANVLAFGLRLTTETLARELVDAFLANIEVDPGEQATILRVE